MSIDVRLRRLPHAEGLPLPAYETEHAAGMDLRAAVDEAVPIILAPGQRAMVPTGLCIALPAGYEAQVRPRSGLAAKHGITCLNTPGTIDADYRGEVKVILINLGQESFAIQRGERIAQMVVAPVTRAAWTEVQLLDDTARGAGGFGSHRARVAPMLALLAAAALQSGCGALAVTGRITQLESVRVGSELLDDFDMLWTMQVAVDATVMGPPAPARLTARVVQAAPPRQDAEALLLLRPRPDGGYDLLDARYGDLKADPRTLNYACR